MSNPQQNPEIAPGEKLSNLDKAALERDNLKLTQQAQEQAARQREQDIRSGNARPLHQTIADSIKGKLEREEFHQK